ncbi:MAG: RNA polymerase sigma factor [Anaerovoracaceae bacterium]
MERNERDAQILQLFEQRSEEAISAATLQYGGLCRQIAMNILGNAEDAEECVNDPWLAVWNRIPPEQPRSLTAYICRIVRNLSMDRMDYLRAGKRDAAATSPLKALMELQQDVSVTDLHLESVSEDVFRNAFNGFLAELPKEMRQVFVRRYWFGDSLAQLSVLTGFTESKLKSMLHRMRKGLRQRLEEEGVAI